MSTKRRQLVELRKRVKCQSKQQYNARLMDLDAELLSVLSNQIKALDEDIQRQITADAQMNQQSKVLRSIPGIGPVLCAALIGEMPELGTIGDKQIATLAGVAPINKDSGRNDGRRSIKGGRYNVRCLLYQAALVASTHNQPLKEFALRLKEKGKPHKVVLIAVARKLLIIANSLVAKNQTWRTS